MRKINADERKRVNEYFSETGWELENDVEVLVFSTLLDLSSYLGYETKNKTFEELEDAVSDSRNVWFDGEDTNQYYLITQ